MTTELHTACADPDSVHQGDLPAPRLIRGALRPADVVDLATTLAQQHGLPVTLPADIGSTGTVRIGDQPDAVELHWRPAAPGPPGTLGIPARAVPQTEVTLTTAGTVSPAAERLLSAAARALRRQAAVFGQDELATITEAMPLVRQFSDPCPALASWAVIFRDHYVENSLGFLLGLQHAGVPPARILALAKGDRTRHRARIHATFEQLGYHSDVLDNALLDNALLDSASNLGRTPERDPSLALVDAFIHDAHAHGLRVMVIDDGGLLAQGYGGSRQPVRVDGAIELTVSGLKRIADRDDLDIPVLNLARSRLKTRLAYREIADSCVRRLRTVLPGQKFPGRRVLLAGFGTLGRRVARLLRDLGCRVLVVDPDALARVEAAEDGFETRRTVRDALTADPPFLLVGTSGEPVLTPEDLALLPDGAYLAGFATRDFSVLTGPAPDVGRTLASTEVPGVGVRYHLPGGKAVLLLGDGRSLNLFDADDIPNQGYDTYRAGTLLAAKFLAQEHHRLPAGVHVDRVDRMLAESGLFEACYDLHIQGQPATR